MTKLADLTPAQQLVVKRLAHGSWTLDRHGKNGMQGIMSGPRGAEATIAAKTVSFLFSEGLIYAANDNVSDFQLTREGWILSGMPKPIHQSLGELLERTASAAHGSRREAARQPEPVDRPATFQVGDLVTKFTGDYQLPGEVRAVYTNRRGSIRYVVEHYAGIQHIYGQANLRPYDPKTDGTLTLVPKEDPGDGNERDAATPRPASQAGSAAPAAGEVRAGRTASRARAPRKGRRGRR